MRQRLAPVRNVVAWQERTEAMISLDERAALERALRELHTLRSVTERLNEAVSVDEAVSVALAEVTDLLGLSTGWVFLLDETGAFVPMDAIGLPPALAEDDARELRRLPECECQYQVRTGQLKRAVNIIQCSRLAEAPGDTRGLRYHASIPIRARKRVLGILNVSAPARESFSAADMQVLGTIGDQLGMAIERARLLDVARGRHLREQAMLLRLSQALLSSLDPQQVTEMVVEEAASVLRGDAAALLLYGEANDLSMLATWGWREDIRRDGEVRRARGGLLERVFASRAPVVEAELQAVEPVEADLSRLHGWRSAVAVPVDLYGECIGVLSVNSRVPGHFDDDDARLLGLIAAQAALAVRNAREYEEKAEEAWHRNALLQVAENLRDAETIEDILERVGHIAPLFLGASQCAFFLWDSDGARFVPRQLITALEDSARREARFRALTSKEARAFERLLAERSPILVQRGQGDDGALLDVFGVEQVLLVPLVAHGLLVGAMLLDPSLEDARFTPRLLEIAAGMANQTAIAIENERLRRAEIEAQRLARELELARHIQRSFLPDAAPGVRGWDVCAHWEPARVVTGDFYDFVPLDDGQLGVVIADVSDKGAPAAIFMAVSRSLLRASILADATPATAIGQSNRLIAADAESSMFVTAFYMTLAPDGAVCYVNAGHNPPLLLRADGRVEWVGQEAHGPALGIVPEVEWQQGVASLAAGDLLLLYTDGVTEAIDGQGDAFGEERLLAVVRAARQALACDVARTVVGAVADFAAGQPAFDDITLVILRKLAASG
ncbi:MAG: SpoIIE family protein phosphatase [Anaerolineae bacterium]|nr:SpoIIE family protein phosphatase [Anaerolineae bacterium]